jgi:hypothetical protein
MGEIAIAIAILVLANEVSKVKDTISQHYNKKEET